MTIKVGIIGCGRIAQKHVNTINKLKGVKITALSDISVESMDNLLLRIQSSSEQKIATYSYYKSLLHDSNVDLVIISTISSLHAEMTKEALLAKKHVLVEKPLALTLDQSRNLHQLANQCGKKLFVCYQLRYIKTILMIKEMLNQGLFGELYYGAITIEINRSEHYYKEANWRGKWDLDGGMLINQGIHLVDLLVWFLGDVVDVDGCLIKKNDSKETEDAAMGIFTFKSGAKGILHANTITLPTNIGYSIRLFGEKGTVALKGTKLQEIERFEVEGVTLTQEELETWIEDQNEHTRMYEAVIDSIQGNEQPYVVNGKESERALEAIFALYQSAIDKNKTYLPLSTFETSWMKGKI
ncbi:Gfo/Idh/MocA family oxidoreductase [Alkalihalophilus lindianensis]|uniref:Gfo/Idh/MocA family oxidoreductase n=1 Tax=Alkalihalophilus lindianensis TaxID=1630542 RepID=A0ABU3XB40_9BACI|nr:Gfo/Idh/MocA family oxidoreductase [Alkalihalophilus lindianensis]MDV2685096.1 Gfo/Idh/MocA family oxidoreductase [Alkalihalophilus lindianensis]